MKSKIVEVTIEEEKGGEEKKDEYCVRCVCCLCEGKGRRWIRQAPDYKTLKKETCCDCNGSGFFELKQTRKG